MPGGETPTALSYQGNIVIPTQVQNSAVTAASPAAGTTVTSVTIVPGEYTINWTVGLAGTTPGNTDRDNFGLYQGATLLATSANQGQTGEFPQNPIVVSVLANTVIAVKVIATTATGATYDASIDAVPVFAVSPDDPLFPYNALTANGTTVTVTSTPVNVNVVMAGIDLGAQAQCVLGKGTQVPAGTTDFGFVDTTYLPTQAQQLTVPGGAPAGSGYYGY